MDATATPIERKYSQKRPKWYAFYFFILQNEVFFERGVSEEDWITDWADKHGF